MATIAKLPLTKAEKAEAVRRLLAEHKTNKTTKATRAAARTPKRRRKVLR
ncbi:MAG: hypothetical protein K8T25_04365 [Planctomycetia bacterium]|nr:hypothetical protein [Planctomycetia bacterium]